MEVDKMDNIENIKRACENIKIAQKWNDELQEKERLARELQDMMKKCQEDFGKGRRN